MIDLRMFRIEPQNCQRRMRRRVFSGTAAPIHSKNHQGEHDSKDGPFGEARLGGEIRHHGASEIEQAGNSLLEVHDANGDRRHSQRDIAKEGGDEKRAKQDLAGGDPDNEIKIC